MLLLVLVPVDLSFILTQGLHFYNEVLLHPPAWEHRV